MTQRTKNITAQLERRRGMIIAEADNLQIKANILQQKIDALRQAAENVAAAIRSLEGERADG